MGYLQDIATCQQIIKDYFETINNENELSIKEDASEVQSEQESEFSDDDEYIKYYR